MCFRGAGASPPAVFPGEEIDAKLCKRLVTTPNQVFLRGSTPVNAASSYLQLRLLFDVHCLLVSGIVMTLPRSAELRWQQEMIEMWLNTACVPPAAQEGLLEMLQAVKKEMEELHACDQRN